jgi:outer membrane protein TolC
LCVALVIVPPAAAQGNPDDLRVELGEQHWYSRFTQKYTPRIVAPVRLSNSSRLDSLVRAGRVYLSLADAIALTLENNVDIEVQRYTFLLNENALRKAESGGSGVPNFDPVLTSNLNWGHNTQAQSNAITSGGLTANTIGIRTLNFGIQQGFVTGGSVTLGLNNNQTTTNNPNNNYNPSTNANLNLQISQPLLQGFGLALNNRNIRIAKNNVKVSDYTFEQQVINTVSTVSQTYWNLVSAILDVEAKTAARNQAQRLYDDNKKQVEIGTMAPIEITRAEASLEATKTDLLTSEGNVLTQETNLKNLLSRVGLASPLFADARIVPTDRVRLPEVEPVEPVQDLVQKATDRRPDLAQARMQIENSRITMTGTRNAMLPQLNLVSTLQNNALSGSVNEAPNLNPITGALVPRQTNPYFVGGYGNILAQIFRRNFPNYSIGFQLNIPLRNRAAQADYATAQLQLRQSELNYQKTLNQIRADIQNALTAVQQTRARYQSATKSRVLQEQTLDAEEKKNALGASTVYNVILVQRDLANARQAEVTALTAYAQAKLQLDVATGLLLERNNIRIDEARNGRVSRAPDAIPDIPSPGAAQVKIAPGTLAARP